MFKSYALILLTAFGLTTPIYAEEMSPSDTNMHNTSSMNMQSNDQQSTQMQEQMKKMQDMHNKMLNAKTPEEKKNLMLEQMPMMQQGMTMMQNMANHGMGGDMTKRQEMIEKRMDMMQTMMQMMMDHQMMLDHDGMNHKGMMDMPMMKNKANDKIQQEPAKETNSTSQSIETPTEPDGNSGSNTHMPMMHDM